MSEQWSISEQRQHEKWMTRALELAERAEVLGEVPVGAVIVSDNEIVGEGYNQPISSHDPSAHAEIIALRAAAAHLQNYRLPACSLYVTIEPCVMCAGAIIHARLKGLYYGAAEPRAGAVNSRFALLDSSHLNHQVKHCSGVMEESCKNIIQVFFRSRRAKK